MAYIFPVEMVAGGLTVTVDPSLFPADDIVVYLYTTSSFTLTGDINIGFTNNCQKGYSLKVYQASTSVTRGGRRIEIVCPTGGFSYNEDWQFKLTSVFEQFNADSTNFSSYVWWDLISGTGVDASTALLDGSVTFSKLQTLTDGNIIVGDGSNRPAAVAVTGDVTISNAGVTAIGAGVIVNADINTSAAIARNKLANGTASQVVINDGSGVMTSEAQLAAVRGGTGQDFSASTGFQTWNAGTASVGAISEVITVPVSWESGEQCNNRVKIPFAGTITNIYAVVTKALSGTDAGTIVPKNAASTNMTLASALSFAASSALETAIDTNVSANNTVAANDIIYLTTAKTTVGGKALVSITITRTS